MAHRLNFVAHAPEFDIDILRVTTAEPVLDVAVKINESIERGYIQRSPSRFPALEDIVKFCGPQQAMASARSVIVGAGAYFIEEPEDLSESGQPHGLIARYTRRNYYRDLRKKLIRLAKHLKKEHGGQYRAYANGPVAEKPLARRAGVGFYGKHGVMVNKDLGSWFVLGELITDIDLEPDTPVTDDCGPCQLCITKCPTRAIVEPYVLDWSKCLQYLTNWHGILPESFRGLWGKRLYGCTTCQDVCPKNKKVKPKSSRPSGGDVGASFPLLRILRMSREEYFDRFRQNQMGAAWINFDCIRRNAVTALGNAGDPVAVEPLTECLGDKEPMLRAHAAWALGRVGGGKAKAALEKAGRAEDNPEVRGDVDSALQQLAG